MRDEFLAITSGWTLVSGFNAISERLEELADWVEKNGPLQPDEEQTVQLMVNTQIARGIEEGVE